MRITALKLIFAISLVFSCSSINEKQGDFKVKPPSEIQVQRLGRTSVKISWKDNSEDESGFSIWLRKVDDLQNLKELGRVGKNTTEYIVNEGLEEGLGYYFGVRAEGSSESESSDTKYVIFNMTLFDEIPSIKIEASPISSWAGIAIKYKFGNIKSFSGLKFGLCWSSSHNPTVSDDVLYGPRPDSPEKPVLQAVPSSLLEDGTEYTFRAFVRGTSGTFYSEPVKASLKKQPEAIKLEWNKYSSALPQEISVFETTSKLNGRNFHAWYAVADLSKGNIKFQALVPDHAMTIDAQAAQFGADCYLLVNGGYFYNGRHTGLALINSSPIGAVNPVRGSLSAADPEYTVMYKVTRGLFGVDKSSRPFVCWAGKDVNNNPYYVKSPLPSVKGEARYGQSFITEPQNTIDIKPDYALSAGPVLLYEGKVTVDYTETEKGKDYYLNNFEIMPYDIFGEDVICDRTALGYTQDGKIVFFICDGRILESRGANLLELANILKGLDCISAVNFDGGGSTGMMIGGTHINDQTPNNRPVVSTLGIFKK